MSSFKQSFAWWAFAGKSDDPLALIKDAVDANFAQPFEHRRLRYLVELFRGGTRPKSDDIWSRLRPWWGEGERAWVFDNERDTTDLDNRAIGFDMTEIHLMKTISTHS